jgi:hypothetical protein
MAVNFSRKLGFYKVILGGDALQIVQALGKEGSNWCIYDHLIKETREVLHSMQSWKVHHVRRNLNGVAHRLANVALSLSEAHVCFEETPHCISDITFFFDMSIQEGRGGIQTRDLSFMRRDPPTD